MMTAWMVRQGKGGAFAEEMIEAGYMCIDFIGDHDLTPHLVEGLEAFRPAVAYVFQETNPGKSKIPTGQAVNSFWLTPAVASLKATLCWHPGQTGRTSTASWPAATSTIRKQNFRTGAASGRRPRAEPLSGGFAPRRARRPASTSRTRMRGAYVKNEAIQWVQQRE